MATYYQVEHLMAGLIDTNGNPLVGGKVFTYAVGTDTPKDTYLDSEGTTPATNPIVLNAKGQALIFAQGMYKFVIKTVNDVVLDTWDDLSFTVANILATDNTFTGANTFAKEVLGVAATHANGFVTKDQMTAALVTASDHIGKVEMTARTTAPDNTWMICNGSAISRTTYSDLFATIGVTFGTGDGTTTFNIPDLRGRFPIGAGQGTSLTNRPLGEKGGDETKTLTVEEMPAHRHEVKFKTSPNNEYEVDSILAIGQNDLVRTSTWLNTATEGVMEAGGGEAHNVMNPYLGINFIIKVSVA